MEYDKIFERAETWLKTYDSLEDIDDYFYPPSKEDIKRSIEVTKELRKNNNYWEILENEIEDFCKERQLNYKIEFHHGGFSKS